MPPNPERIIVGVDGSEASIDALRWAVRQASLTGAEVEAVLAWEYPHAAGGYPLVAEVDWASNARAVLDAAVTTAFGSKPESVARQIVEGHPARFSSTRQRVPICSWSAVAGTATSSGCSSGR